MAVPPGSGSPCPLTGVEVPVGAVTDLRLLEDSGRRVRLGWTGVPSATEYKVTVRNTQGEPEGWGRGWHHLGGTMGTAEGAEAPALLLADGTERTRRVQGSQTALELGDLREGVTYLVRVSALVGGREGSATTLSVRVSKSSLPAPHPGCTTVATGPFGVSPC